MMNIPDRITKIMMLLDMSPSQVAEKGSIPVDSIYSIRKGQSKNPGAEILRGLSKAFNLSIDYIVSDEDISLETILGNRSLSAPRQAFDANTALDMELYKDALLALEDAIKIKNITISPDMRKHYVNQIYDYAVKRIQKDNTATPIDHAFVEWLIEKKL